MFLRQPEKLLNSMAVRTRNFFAGSASPLASIGAIIAKIIDWLQNFLRSNKRDGDVPVGKNAGNIQGEHGCSHEPVKQNYLLTAFASLRHWFGIVYIFEEVTNTLFQRVRAEPIPPDLIICHDIQTLPAAVKIKKLFKCPVIYDTHEFWPEADLQMLTWEKQQLMKLEKKYIHQVDTVIAVTSQIAEAYKKTYSVDNVLCIPNAEPLQGMVNTMPIKQQSTQIKFLYQGRVSPGRGIDELLSVWKEIADDRFQLIIRSPESSYLDCLMEKYSDVVAQGRMVFSPHVLEKDLILAASSADVGIIPYTGPNLNHVYACPNKLSQYMQAGLMILFHNDQQYVSQIAEKYHCGIGFDTITPHSLNQVMNILAGNPEQLRDFQKNSYSAAFQEFNWKVQSIPYLEELGRLAIDHVDD